MFQRGHEPFRQSNGENFTPSIGWTLARAALDQFESTTASAKARGGALILNREAKARRLKTMTAGQFIHVALQPVEPPSGTRRSPCTCLVSEQTGAIGLLQAGRDTAARIRRAPSRRQQRPHRFYSTHCYPMVIAIHSGVIHRHTAIAKG